MRKAAFFDIDGTIFRSSLLIEITEAMIEAGILPAKLRRYYTEQFTRWLDRVGSYDDYIRGVIVAFESHIKGVKEKDFMDIARKVVEHRHNRVYRFTRDLVRELKAKGYFLVAISNSPKEILDEFCKKMGFDKVYGRIYEVDGRGRCTGKTLYLDLIRDKAKILKRAIEHNNLTMRGSIGVGDTESDIPFLKLVEKPICFNPNSKLYRYARRVGWSVVVERKDVVHKHEFK
ncbi:hypothetical protein A3C96_00325 [Candidatus Uhrbacteria bacterium RIFCSPHIGHO2_02_FULL_60_10]|uniref:phosphoserine phosphatase n=1 Tax=Candidatus Uhrbacteria bacterium RIFCSPHIGHO2_02_FULL_60_10 TaxID=1802392 RepID=A0A1F7U7H2_9BACT|nr:MAG: hypothetical protein A3C96_00325 [Candidatus Uhrbacteria bacterium RIFCSPHIGHO2_02_FULL_60_10]